MLNHNTSQTIVLLRFPLAVMVVFIHSVDPVKYNVVDISWSDLCGYDIYLLIRSTISHVISLVAVPSFFLISGYLFFKKLEVWNWDIWKIKLKSRFYTLLVPYIIWTCLRVFYNRNLDYLLESSSFDLSSYFSVLFSKFYIFGYFWHCFYSDDTVNWWGTPTLLSVPLHVPFWYLRDLIVLTLLSPFIYLLMKKWGGYILLFVGSLFISFTWPTWPFIYIKSVFFFMVGAYLSINRKDLLQTIYSMRYIIYLLPLLIVMMVLSDGNSSMYSIITPWFILVGVVSIIYFTSKLQKQTFIKAFNKLSETSFFIFAFHIFVFVAFGQIEKQLTIHYTWPLLITLYFVKPLLAIVVSISIYYILRMVAPRISSYICGYTSVKTSK